MRLLEVPADIHTLVQDADDYYAIRTCLVIDHV